MTEDKIHNLGRALTALCLEDRFLESGDLSNLPVLTRAGVVNEIISEELRLGRYGKVIDMVFGGFGKVDVLYDGDKDELRDAIVSSAIEGKSEEVTEERIKTLSRAGEDDLIFKLAINLPSMNYKTFSSAIESINQDYFEDSEQGAFRKRRVQEIAATKAMNQERYNEAFRYFLKIYDYDSIDQIFEKILSSGRESYTGGVLEDIVLSDPEKKEERLKRIVLSSVSEGDVSPETAFEWYRKYSVELSPEELERFRERVTSEISECNVLKKLEGYPEEKLLWAKKHASSSPALAYTLFREQGFEGEEVITAANAVLSLPASDSRHSLDLGKVREEHLRRVYENASFDVKAKIALYLEEPDKLQSLSAEAKDKGDLDLAYRLWVKGKGSLDGDYIRDIRKVLIQKDIRGSGYMFFLDNSDSVGRSEAYDALMQDDKGSPFTNSCRAYGLALDLGDEDRIQRARERIVSADSTRAVYFFRNERRDDKKGLDYALGVVSSEHGVDSELLNLYVCKYLTQT
jgi:hypothetical protein